jgi:hypothetical protein
MLSKLRLVKSLFYTQKLLYLSIAAGTAALMLLSIISVNTSAVVAQIPPGPTEENGAGDQQLPITNNPSSASNASNIPLPTISITSLEDGQEVPIGELTIEGSASDDTESNCQVYADVNDIAPMQNATAVGTNAGGDDYSRWTFTYTKDYQLIREGSNELTAKISCFDANNPTPISEWHSVNVTGVETGTSPRTGEPTGQEGTASIEEVAPGIGEEQGDIGVDDIMPGVPPSG